MKIRLFLSAMAFLLAARCLGQEYVFDPQYLASITANAAVRGSAESAHDQYLGKINASLDDINTNMGAVVLAQTMIYGGLTEVNSALKDGLALKSITTLSLDMTRYLQQCLELGKAQPYLLLFASGIAAEIRTRAIALITDISGYILSEGAGVLADYGSRDQLLARARQQLRILDGLAYGAYRAMYWAARRGLVAAAGPYGAWISRDRAFVSQIIAQAKYLK
jgi:hypothetical protein